MNVAILGTDQASQIVAEIIEKHYNPWLKTKSIEPLNVVAYIVRGGVESPAIGDKAVLNLVQFVALYHKKIIDKIIFPREIYNGQNIFLFQLQRLGVELEDIYITSRLNNSIDLLNFIEVYILSGYMPYIEFRIADHCNMNCKACSEFSGLVKEPHFPNLKKFTQDFEQLRKFIDDIGTIRILGGEPLLNPEVNEYVKLSRRLYPQANVIVVTNALILTKMPEEFFNTVRECNAAICISPYLPLKGKINEIEHFLRSKKVRYSFNPKTIIEKFFLNTTLTPHDKEKEMFLTCPYSNCRNLWEGKIGVCYKPTAIKFFNDYFKQNLPENSGLIDLYDETLTTEKIKRRLFESFELCRYCTPIAWREWGRISYPSPISDWLSN